VSGVILSDALIAMRLLSMGRQASLLRLAGATVIHGQPEVMGRRHRAES